MNMYFISYSQSHVSLAVSFRVANTRQTAWGALLLLTLRARARLIRYKQNVDIVKTYRTLGVTCEEGMQLRVIQFTLAKNQLSYVAHNEMHLYGHTNRL